METNQTTSNHLTKEQAFEIATKIPQNGNLTTYPIAVCERTYGRNTIMFDGEKVFENARVWASDNIHDNHMEEKIVELPSEYANERWTSARYSKQFRRIEY